MTCAFFSRWQERRRTVQNRAGTKHTATV